jgi:tetratricopeptide (TPR) repeat protein
LRDLALAWESLAKEGVPGADEKADQLLSKAMAQDPQDPAILGAYAYEKQTKGALVQAKDLYQRALRADPTRSVAESDLAVIEAKSGNMAQAIALWKDAFRRTPWRSAIGTDLALSLCESGRYDEARAAILRVLEFNPDFGEGKGLLRLLSSDRPAGCRQRLTPPT